MTLLTLDEMAAARRDLDDWKIEPGMMEKEFSFPDFKTALDFVNKVGELAEEEDHHPDIFLSWGKVHIQLTTHSENGLTGKDVHLAKRIETP